MGKPRIEIDETHLKGICRLKPTLRDVAAFFDCSEDTIERRCKALGALSFADFRDKNMVQTRFNLIRTAIRKAENGDNTMLIFCLKNLCGWVDRYENKQIEGTDPKALVAEARELIRTIEEKA